MSCIQTSRIFLILFSILTVSAAHSYQGVDLTFIDQIDESDVSIVGTVAEIEYVKGSGNIPVATVVRLDPVKLVTGSGTEDMGVDFKIRYWGGLLPSEKDRGQMMGYSSSGNPQFTLEEDVIVFLADNGKSFIPFVGGPSGLLRIAPNGIVTNAEGLPFVELTDDGRLLTAIGSEVNRNEISEQDIAISPQTNRSPISSEQVLTLIEKRLAETDRSDEVRAFFRKPLPALNQ